MGHISAQSKPPPLSLSGQVVSLAVTASLPSFSLLAALMANLAVAEQMAFVAAAVWRSGPMQSSRSGRAALVKLEEWGEAECSAATVQWAHAPEMASGIHTLPCQAGHRPAHPTPRPVFGEVLLRCVRSRFRFCSVHLNSARCQLWAAVCCSSLRCLPTCHPHPSQSLQTLPERAHACRAMLVAKEP